MWQAPQVQHEWSMLRNSEEEVACSRWDQCYSHCWGDELPTCPYNIFPSMILALFVQGHTSDGISKHNHSIVSCVSKHYRSITSCWKWWDQGVMEKRMVTGHSHWDYRQPTVITSMAWVTSQMLLIFPLTTLNYSVYNLYLLLENLKLLINNNRDTKEREDEHVEWVGSQCQLHLLA